MVVEPIKKVYIYENEISVEHFYIAKHVSGEFGSGEGEEYQADRNRGVYIPKLLPIKDIPNTPLMPPEIAQAFFEDYCKNGKNVRDNFLTINAKLH